MTEAVGRAGSGSPGADQRGEARAGLRLSSRVVSLDAAVRRGFTKADGMWGFTAGISWRLRAGK